jgi:glycosyltransferase involved in cell wall biosynthesis
MRVAVVAPRYGTEIVGGSEAAMRMIAERLVSQLHWRVEALTTCATDYMTWDNELPAGESSLNGVRVRRFPAVHSRRVEFDILSYRLLAAPALASPTECDRWIELQGPRCPELITALGDCDADVVVFSPYLYYPAVRGIEVVARRSILHPAAHDEAQIYLPAYRDLFAGAAAFVYNGRWEQSFVQQLFGVAGRPALTLGLGVEDPDEGDLRRAGMDLDPLGLGGQPYVCCLGRIEPGKGTTRLARMFAAYKRAHPGPLLLVMVGPVAIEPPSHPDIVLAGQVDEALKWALIDGALGLVSPSPFESFALVLLEAWTRGKPVLVNAECEATREQCELSGGGLSYVSPETFEDAIDRLVSDGDLRRRLGESGRAYVDSRFRWPDLIERWGAFAEQVAERGSGS